MSHADAPKASQNEYWSVDSQPADLSGRVALWKAPAVLCFFVVFSSVTLLILQHDRLLGQYFPTNDWVFLPVEGQHFIAIRHFVMSVFVSFGLFANGSLRHRLGFIADLLVSFLVACLLIDLFAYVLWLGFGAPIALRNIQIATGLVGFALFSARLFKWGKMPLPVVMKITPRAPAKSFLRFGAVLAIAGYVSWYVAQLDLKLVATLRSVSLLGGLGPGVFLFLPTFFLVLYLLARFDLLRRHEKSDFAPDITIVIPAHNEEYILENTLGAIDRAAAQYDGQVFVFLVDNNSSDATAEIAQRVFDRADHARGTVLKQPIAGKANALNLGFSRVQTEFVIRIDADTQIEPESLRRAMRHYSDPTLGCLGGVPNTRGRSFFERSRLAEVLVNHGYYAISNEAIDAQVAIPGMFAVYRSELVRELGGFAFGLNGEDSDMSMRIGELGYRISVDPHVRYESEVPATYAHMREQRMRWFRSAFHITARCLEATHLSRRSLRGIIVLPIMLLNTAVRTMTLPLLLFGLIEVLEPFDTGPRPVWVAIGALVLGAPTLVSMLAILINRTPRALLYLPEYTVFRALRAYFTLESMLSITLGPPGVIRRAVVLPPLAATGAAEQTAAPQRKG